MDWVQFYTIFCLVMLVRKRVDFLFNSSKYLEKHHNFLIKMKSFSDFENNIAISVAWVCANFLTFASLLPIVGRIFGWW